MPIYEEKLISPLALRYTQEHIRTTFRDERLVEESYAQIEARAPPASVKDYDIVLHAPFPNIEIIRFHEPTWKAGKENGRDDHWFTLDNRRLYCLQRAAVAHWPLRVAAVVDILYADTGSVWKKYDTETQGRVVTISHSIKQAPIRTWEWLEEIKASCACPTTGWEYVDPRGNAQGPFTLAQMKLWNSMGYFLPTLRMRCEPNAQFTAFNELFPEGSSVPFESFPKKVKAEDEKAVELVLEDDLKPSTDSLTTAPGDPNSLSAQLLNACHGSDAPLALAQQNCEQDKDINCPTPSTTAESKESDAEVVGDNGSATTATNHGSALAQRAIAEVENQLNDAASKGYIWIPTWNDVYYHELGSLRRFLEKQPDKFIVTPGAGKKYQVQMVNASANSHKTENDYDALAERSVAEIEAQLKDPSYNGFIWMPTWNDVYYKKLGSLRRFAESRDDIFTVVAGTGKTYRITLKADPSEGGDYNDLADRAISEIEKQLKDPGRQGFVRIPTWNDQYYHKLGSLRRFVESQPDRFKVTAGVGKTYSVEPVDSAESCHECNVKDAEVQPSGGRKWIAKVAPG